MTISAFTFIKNGEILGYPFLQSIKSILSIVDEFVVNVGDSEDDTLQLIQSLNDPKIRIIQSKWNDKMKDRGYVYGQQKMIAQFNCTSDWAFYLEGDEIIHENDLQKIKDTCEQYVDDDDVEAVTFDYFHFYGNANSYLDSPAWYRREARIIKNSVRSYAPDGLFWLVLEKNKIGRYPNAVHSGANMYHYGWVRSEEQMNLKSQKVQKYWNKKHKAIDYKEIDGQIIKEFKGSHPTIVKDWLPKVEGLFKANPDYKLTRKEKKHRIMIKLENWFGLELSKKHYKLIK
ncbi:MAG: glycosyltransferase [Arcobacteraceae bacterium]|nr:glycosyltransferase [Arcobacteraceae bacterium]